MLALAVACGEGFTAVVMEKGNYGHLAKARLVSSGSALTQTSCCRCALAGLTKCLVARLLSWWLLETRTQPA